MKSIKYLAAAAMAMLAIGCAKEQVGSETPDGQEINVTFNASLPEGIQTRAIGDGTTANELVVAVYDNATGNELTSLRTTKEIKMRTTVEFNLVKGKTYSFVFWAQAKNNGYYKIEDMRNIIIDYTGKNANDEKRDAFFATRMDMKVVSAMSETVELHRPFSQVNFGTTDFDKAKAAGFEPTLSSFTATAAATVFDPVTGEGKNGIDITLTENDIPSEDLKVKIGGVENKYKWMAMNYFIPEGKIGEKKVSDVTATFKAGTQTVTISAPNAPVRSNYRTNILGSLLTDQTIFNVVIDPVFNEVDKNDTDYSDSPDYIYNKLALAFANGGVVTLTKDVELTKELIVPAGKSVVLDLGGKTISNTQDIWNDISEPHTVSLISVEGGTLTIKGAGKIKAKENDCYTFNVKDNGKLIIEDGEFVGNISVVQVQEGSAEIRGGKFSLAQKYTSLGNGSEYLINLIDDARKAGTATAIVYGGTFEIFNPSNNLAEGANTNFVAPGYKSTKVGDYYVVAKDGESLSVSVSGQDELDHILANIPSGENTEISLGNGTYTLPETVKADGVTISGQTGDEVIDCSSTTTVTAKNATITNVVVKGNGAKTNGSSLAMNGANATVKGCTFQNGRQDTYGSDISVSQGDGGTATIIDSDFRKSGFRGIMIWNTGAEIKIDNCLFDNTYPFNCNAGKGKITVTNSELKGWTSYTSGLDLISFTNCTFGKSTSGYAYLVPYSKTVVKDCTFSADFCVSPSGSDVFTIEFINCKYEDGTPINSNIMDTVDVNRNAQWIIDGTTYTY